MVNANSTYEVKPEFDKWRRRLSQLERWYDLAIRPSMEDCHPDDKDLLNHKVDDMDELKRRCISVRKEMNRNLVPHLGNYESHLNPRKSRIPEAGQGLFYDPKESCLDDANSIPPNTELCYYWGHLHNFQSSRLVEDKSYLMVLHGNTLVDPGPLPQVKARYINDPLNESLTNCKFVVQEYRAVIVSTKTINPGDELFMPYGEAYWAQYRSIARYLS